MGTALPRAAAEQWSWERAVEALRRCATPAAGEGLLGALARLVEQPPPPASFAAGGSP